MRALNLLLDLVGLSLWLNWQSGRLKARHQRPSISLLDALKSVDTGPARGNFWLAALVILLTARAVFYWNLGPSLDWIPTLHLGAVALAFRNDFLGRMFLFSGLSFGVVLCTFYLWLLLLLIANRDTPTTHPVHAKVRRYLAWIDPWPTWMKWLLPWLTGSCLWFLANPFLVHLGMVPPAKSWNALFQQTILVGLGAYLAWKYLLVGLFLLYWIDAHILLGTSPLWKYINNTARHLLRPLQRWPIHLGKFDLRPLAGIALVLFIAALVSYWLPEIYQQLPY